MPNKTSCIEHPARAALLIIREDYLAITDGDHCAAAILAYFEHWTNTKLDEIEQYVEALAQGEDVPMPDVWVFASVNKIVADLFSLYGRSKVISESKRLEEIGFLETRHNPRNKWDRALQYKLNVDWVQTALSEIRPSIVQKQTMHSSKTDNRLAQKRTIPELPSELPSELPEENDSSSPDGDGSAQKKSSRSKKQAAGKANATPSPSSGAPSPFSYGDVWEAVKEVWGHDGARAGLIAGVIAGVSQKKGWKEFNFEKPGTPTGVRVFKVWYEQACRGAALPEDPEAIQAWYGKMRTDYQQHPDKAVFEPLRATTPAPSDAAPSKFGPRERN